MPSSAGVPLRSATRAWVYDRVIAGMTSTWYRHVLGRLPHGAQMLDVGIGTGAALARCADVVRDKELAVVGLDIDRDYLARCQAALGRADLTDHVVPMLGSVYDHCGGPYDAVYFSASLMLLPDPAAAISHVASLLSPEGRLFSTQTFHHRRSALLEWAKPLAQHVTTIHFGRVTYEDEFRKAFADAGVELEELSTMRSTRHSSHRLAVARVPDAA
jgi:SAM-dependent methyltransferase